MVTLPLDQAASKPRFRRASSARQDPLRRTHLPRLGVVEKGELDGSNDYLASHQHVWGLYLDEQLVYDHDADGDGDFDGIAGGSDKRYYVVHAFLYSASAVIDLAGAVIERYDYEPYGSPTLWSASYTIQYPLSTDHCPFLFTGQMYDPETGLCHYKARALHPSLGRFLQRDEFKAFVAPSLYVYVRSEPLALADPSGWGEYEVDPTGGFKDTPDSCRLDMSMHGRLRALNERELTEIRNSAWDTVWAGYLYGYTNAARHLRHFLEGTGATLTIDFEQMNKESLNAERHLIRELNDALAAAEQYAKRGEEVHIVTVADVWARPGNQSGDWLYAVGEYRTWAKGTVTCDPKTGDYTLRWSFFFRDNYDWDPTTGKKGGFVSDKEMWLLHVHGFFSREYMMRGRQDKTITWKKGWRYAQRPLQVVPPGSGGRRPRL